MIEFVITHHIDEGEGFRYEYDLYEAACGENTLRARRYTSDPAADIAVLGAQGSNTPSAYFSLYDLPEATEVVSALRARGFTNISVLDQNGYAPLDEKRLNK